MLELASRLRWRRHASRDALNWHEIDRFLEFDPGRQRQELSRRLRDQIVYFGNRADALPEWREAAKIQDPAEIWRIWPSLPAVTKDLLRSRFQPREMQRRFQLEGRADSTGGSTGEPTHFFHDRAMTRATFASDIFSRLRMGWRLGMATAFVWGSERDVGKSVHWRTRLHYRLANEIPIAAYELSARTVEDVLAVVRSHRRLALYGFTSMLDYVARAVIDSGVILPGVVHSAWNGGEMLFPEQSARFRQAFGVPILNRYGGRELGAMACQFRGGENGPLHLLRPWVLAEVVDDSGRPASPGQPGRLLFTSTICRGTPFIRYEIGDVGRGDVSVMDESGLTALSHIEGRIAGLLELRDGRQISCLFWNHLFKEFSEIRQFQVVKRGDGSLEILLEGDGLLVEREAGIKQVLSNLLGRTPFQIRWVDRIPRTTQGKLVQVVNESGQPSARV
jgi:phenylacetate-CoA ligase